MSFSLKNKIFQKIFFLILTTMIVSCDDSSTSDKNTSGEEATMSKNKVKKNKVKQENNAIDVFNQNIAIKTERFVETLEDGSIHVKFEYTITNRGKSDILGVYWNPIHIHDNNILYTVPIHINFDSDFKPGAEFSIATDYDLDKLQESDPNLKPEAVKLLSDPNIPIQTLILAKGILFSNGDKLEVN